MDIRSIINFSGLAVDHGGFVDGRGYRISKSRHAHKRCQSCPDSLFPALYGCQFSLYCLLVGDQAQFFHRRHPAGADGHGDDPDMGGQGLDLFT